MKKQFVLFDFDGVIADSFALAYDVARIVHPEANLSPDDYRALFEGNIYDSITKKIPGGIRHDIYFSTFAPRMKGEVTLVAGMDAVVQKLAADFTLIIISSTATPHIREFLERHDLSKYFADVMGSDVHTSKVEKIRMVLEKYATTPDHCVFITDTLGDIREAKAHEIGVIGVTWGWHSRETLGTGIPFRIVEMPADLPDTIDEYFAR